MEKSCGAVVYRAEGGKKLFLLLHYFEGHWDLPKGHVEKGEDEKSTAKREVFEETGIKELEFDPLFREIISYSFKRARKKVPKEVVFFLAKTSQENIRLSDEHINHEWLDVDSAKSRATYESAKKVLEKAEKHLSSLG